MKRFVSGLVSPSALTCLGEVSPAALRASAIYASTMVLRSHPPRMSLDGFNDFVLVLNSDRR